MSSALSTGWPWGAPADAPPPGSGRLGYPGPSLRQAADREGPEGGPCQTSLPPFVSLALHTRQVRPRAVPAAASCAGRPASAGPGAASARSLPLLPHPVHAPALPSLSVNGDPERQGEGRGRPGRPLPHAHPPPAGLPAEHGELLRNRLIQVRPQDLREPPACCIPDARWPGGPGRLGSKGLDQGKVLPTKRLQTSPARQCACQRTVGTPVSQSLNWRKSPPTPVCLSGGGNGTRTGRPAVNFKTPACNTWGLWPRTYS